MEQEFLKEVKRMNSFLEAIDWKLWEIYKKMSMGMSEQNNALAAELAITPVEKKPIDKDLATAIDSTLAKQKVAEPEDASEKKKIEPVVPVPIYPNIEKWK